MNNQPRDSNSDSSQSIAMFRRLDTVLWLAIGAAIIGAASTLYSLKLETATNTAVVSLRLVAIEQQLDALTKSVLNSQVAEARITLLERAAKEADARRRAFQTDINVLWQATKLSGNPKINDITQ